MKYRPLEQLSEGKRRYLEQRKPQHDMHRRMLQNEIELIPREEARAILGVSDKTFYRWEQDEEIPLNPIKFGDRVSLYLRGEVIDLLCQMSDHADSRWPS